MTVIKPHHGYWETTVFPIGGAFRRVGDMGLVVKVNRMFHPLCYGCNAEGETLDGRKVAFNLENTE